MCQALNEVRASVTEGEISRDDAARRVVKIVEGFGLQPVEPAPALEPIDQSDSGVVCWMAMLPEPR